MSPFLVYLLFQADAICALFGIFGALFGVTGACFWGASFEQICSWDDKEQLAASKIVRAKIGKRMIAAGSAFLIFSFLMPSPRTIAAMIVLPKITSPQALDTMGKESRDIYELAKKALSKLADDKPAESGTK